MAWKNLCNDVEILSQYPEVALAITESTTPVPGYLYGEITSITYIEYGKNCKTLVSFLVSKLDVNSIVVSERVLKLLLYLVKNGHYEVIDAVKAHEMALKESLSFHGPPDNLHGKTFYENIRKMAKEILDYVFSENIIKNENMPASVDTKLTGYGSSSTSASKLSGFGYSVKSQKTVSDLVTDGITNLVDKIRLSNDKDDPQPTGTELSESLPQYKPLVINRNQPDVISGLDDVTRVTSVTSTCGSGKKISRRVYKPGRAGGGWDDSDDDDDEDNNDDESSPPQSEPAVATSQASFDSFDASKPELKDTTVDWTEERKVVEEFTINESLNKLSFDTISSLCKSCSALNCDKILVFLIEKLSDSTENTQLRALVLVEYLVFHDVATLESLQKIVSPSLDDLLEEKTENLPTSVKTKATKVNLIIHNLSKIYEQQQAETSLKIS